jgi:hypothetical protein
MYAANATKVYEVTTSIPAAVKTGQTSGNYVASQMSNAGGEWMIVVNDAGDPLLRYNGTTWATLAHTTPAVWAVSTAYAVGARARDATDNSDWKCAIAHTSPGTGTFAAARTASPGQWVSDSATDSVTWITGPVGTPVEHGSNLTYVCKYRNRLFFIERNSMNAWYLPLNSVGGVLLQIPLSGAATKGGKLLFCASWSIDAGDGIDDKLVFCTDLGELLIFTGGDPGVAANWRQEGRYDISSPLGMNAHILIGGELLVATVDGIVPVSGAITKSRVELELAAVTRTIKPMWREEVAAKRQHPWTMCKWDEYGGIFTTFPGGVPGEWVCLATNAATGAHARFTGWDVMCFIRMRSDMFFGTQTGQIMQMDRTGYDNGLPYIATLVGGWEMFQSPSQTVTWRQARASFSARAGEPFQPQLSATTDYVVVLPQPPLAGPDPGLLDIWDEGLWGPNVSGYFPLWTWSQAYAIGGKAYDGLLRNNWDCAVAHTSSATGTFEAYRTAHPSHWTLAAAQPTPNPTPTVPERDAYAQWDQPAPLKNVIRNTGWVSIGMTGFSHAPIVQVTVAQQAKPEVDLINIAATFERDAVVV